VEVIYDLYWSGDFRENISKRLNQSVEKSTDITEQNFSYFIAEENEEVLGVVGIRKCPAHMMEYTKTERPAELYILAVKNKEKGVGRALVERAINEAKGNGYTEIVLYSGETHQDSWGFYDHLNFERVGESVAPNGEKGKVWRMVW
jgi:L-amino acid N-acyltransferase YncA